MGDLSKIPTGWHLCDGTDGTPNLIGQFLQGSNMPGSFIDAALPNIKGSAPAFSWSDGGSGALWAVNSESPHRATLDGSGARYLSILFDASKSNLIYKDDCNTVQPPAYTVYYIIKIA